MKRPFFFFILIINDSNFHCRKSETKDYRLFLPTISIQCIADPAEEATFFFASYRSI